MGKRGSLQAIRIDLSWFKGEREKVETKTDYRPVQTLNLRREEFRDSFS